MKIIQSKIIAFIHKQILIKIFKNISSFIILKGDLKGLRIYSPVVFNQMFGQYEKNVELFLKKELKHDSCILDIGAYNGYTGFLSQKIIEKLGSKQKVFMIEANREVYLNILKAIEFNKINDVIALNYFINSNNFNKNKIYIDESKMIQKKVNDNLGDVKVQYLSFDNLIYKLRDEYNAYPNVLILDIEGFEYDLIESKSELMKKHFNIMIIEYHSKKIFDLLIKNFNEYIFSFEHRINKKNFLNGHFFIKKNH